MRGRIQLFFSNRGGAIFIAIITLSIASSIALYLGRQMLEKAKEGQVAEEKGRYQEVLSFAAQALQARWESGDYNPTAAPDPSRYGNDTFHPCSACNPRYFRDYVNNCLGNSLTLTDYAKGSQNYTVSVSLDTLGSEPRAHAIGNFTGGDAYPDLGFTTDPMPRNGLYATISLTLRSGSTTSTTKTYTQNIILQDTCNEIFIPSDYGNDDHISNSAFPGVRTHIGAYYIDKMEVTNAQYALCVATGICSSPSNTSLYALASYRDTPVTYVTATQAETYCNWLGKRLPSDEEWIKAARGPYPNTRIYPWPDSETISNSHTHYNDGTDNGPIIIGEGSRCLGTNVCDGNAACGGSSWCSAGTCSTTDFPYTDPGDAPSTACSHEAGVSPYGIYNMSGNVAEMVRGRTTGTLALKGGAFSDVASVLAIDTNTAFASNSIAVGFRCVRDCDGKDFGETCSNNSDCCSGLCSSGTCAKMQTGAQCNQNSDCNSGTCNIPVASWVGNCS